MSHPEHSFKSFQCFSCKQNAKRSRHSSLCLTIAFIDFQVIFVLRRRIFSAVFVCSKEALSLCTTYLANSEIFSVPIYALGRLVRTELQDKLHWQLGSFRCYRWRKKFQCFFSPYSFSLGFVRFFLLNGERIPPSQASNFLMA